MNNEELSDQIAKKHCYNSYKFDNSGQLESSYDECKVSAMEMATIKDKEFENQEQSLLWTLYSILDGLAVEGDAREKSINEFKEHLKYYKED
jgi:hypothetical protein